jgi:CRISPR-associated protein Cmr6
MTFAHAFAKVAHEAEKMGLAIPIPPKEQNWETDPKRIPMMYRAQIGGRCSLQYAGKNNQDLDDWRDQWIYPRQNGQPRYQRVKPTLGQQGAIYRIEVKFPYRVFSNCGQDSIARPTIGKDGIPFLPGSSIKGLFRRACTPTQAMKYCGGKTQHNGIQQFLPGSLIFHGAYPIGNWANHIVDLVHPQQDRQVGASNNRTSAFTLISFHQPNMVFEFSSRDSGINWQEITTLLQQALQLGVGGKTSSGYGQGGHFPNTQKLKPIAAITFPLKGSGVSSVLRNGTPEIRPNLFKATLRGHLKRLLGGVSSNHHAVNKLVNSWFGKTDSPASIKIIWQDINSAIFDDVDKEDKNPTYVVEGTLYLDIENSTNNTSKQQTKNIGHLDDIEFLKQVVKFSYVMGGFGKSWRRVWHKQFFPEYHKNKFAIGCHWQSGIGTEIQNAKQLSSFLNSLHQTCCDRLEVAVNRTQSSNWREAWNPNRLAVYSRIGMESKAIKLFHDDTFKTTLAIGGRKPHEQHPKKINAPISVSSVWHRMLPINNNQYLEIITIFHGDRAPWIREGKDQLPKFIANLTENEFQYCWGIEPTFNENLS